MSRQTVSVSPAAVEPNGQGTPPHEQTAAPPNPFDPERLRLRQDFATTLGVRKTLLTIPVRKPDKSWFCRVHPNAAYHLETAVLEVDREIHIVAPEMQQELATEPTISRRALLLSVTRQGVVFFWPIRLPGVDGRIDDWSQSAMDAARMAQQRWCRVAANMHLGAYEVFEAAGELAEPQWPSETLEELLRIAFAKRLIDSPSHPTLRGLRGEV